MNSKNSVNIFCEVSALAEKRKLSLEEQRVRVAEELWLNYFNRTLFEKGVITESVRNKMMHQISARERKCRKKEWQNDANISL